MTDTRPWTRGTSGARAANSTVPAGGEMGVETDTGRVVAANGVLQWRNISPLATLGDLSGKANTADVNTALGNLSQSISGKADASTVYVKGAVDSAIATVQAAAALDATTKSLARVPIPVLLPTVTASTALTKGAVLPVDATAGSLTMIALPALPGLSVGDSFSMRKVDATTNTVTAPFASGDTTSTGATSLVLTMQGTATLVVALSSSGVKIWQGASHVRGDATLDARFATASSVAGKVAKGELMFNVLDYGAIGNGPNDDTAGIQAAIDAAAAANGGIVYLPKTSGFYTATQLRMKSQVTLQGAGWGVRIIQRAGAQGAHLIVLDNVNVQFTVIRDIRLDGNKTNQTGTYDCINYDNTNGSFSFYDPNHIIQRVLLYSPSGNGLTLSANSRESKVTDVYCTGAGGNGFAINCTDSVFVNCTSGAAGKSGWIIAGANSRFTNCKAFGSGSAGVGSDAEGFAIRGRRISMTGCEAQDNAEHGFLIFNLPGAQITLTGCIADSNATTIAGVGFRVDTCTQVALTGCLAFDRNPNGSRHQRFGFALVGICSQITADLICGDNVNGDYSPPATPPTASVIRINASLQNDPSIVNALIFGGM